MKYEIKPSKKFGKDVKRLNRRGYDMSLLTEVLELLADGSPLPSKYQDHPLEGDYAHCRECHITSDWLLIYRIYNDILILYLTRTGTHSDVF